MNRRIPKLSFTLVAAIATAGFWGCGNPAATPGPVGFTGVDDNEANLTQLATPCAFVADGGIMNVTLAADEYVLIGRTAVTAQEGPPNTNLVTVNGTSCGGATVASAKRINVTGDAVGAETVIIDYLNGTFVRGTTTVPGINIDLKGGTDTLKIRGGGNNDTLWLATADAGTASLLPQYAAAVGVDGGAPLSGAKTIIFSGVETVVVSTGPGNDTVWTDSKSDGGFTGLPWGQPNAAYTAPALSIFTGSGDDTVNFGRGPSNSTVSFSGGTEDDLSVGIDTADFSLRTNALGTSLANFIIGGAASGEATEQVTLATDVEVINGGAGADFLKCSAVLACTLNGNAGNDTLTGAAGADHLNGGAGDDLLIPGAGSDVCTGGLGSDTVSYADGVATRAANGTTVTLPDLGAAASIGNGDQVLSESDSLDDQIENVIGSAGVDTINGNDGPNILYGGPLADTINGFAGNDIILMGVSLAADGKDIINGGADEDTVDFSNGGSTLNPAVWANGWQVPVFITLNGASASTTCGTAAANATFCQVTNIENVIGGNGANTITGDAFDNRLEGGPAADTIVGSGGNDTIAPGAGVNSVTCGAIGNSVLLPGGTTTNVGGVCH